MRPPTPAMINLLRHIKESGSITEFEADRRSLYALHLRKLAACSRTHRWALTDAGRRVLAEHPTTGDE